MATGFRVYDHNLRRPSYINLEEISEECQKKLTVYFNFQGFKISVENMDTFDKFLGVFFSPLCFMLSWFYGVVATKNVNLTGMYFSRQKCNFGGGAQFFISCFLFFLCNLLHSPSN